MKRRAHLFAVSTVVFGLVLTSLPISATSASLTAQDAVSQLVVKGRAPKTGYARALFGPAWKDVDGNGCDTRNDILARDLINIGRKNGGCTILRGVLNDPYSGKQVNFVRGVSTSSLVQIDHVVALSDAWQKGAFRWSAEKREAFANDPLELLAVDGSLNMQKGDSDAASWLPPNKKFRCSYVARQIAIKLKYEIWVTSAEKAAMVRVLTPCPSITLPS